MNCSFNKLVASACLIAPMIITLAGNQAIAQGASAPRLNPYLADCYRNVTYIGKIGHHFSITLPHTKTCSIDHSQLPPGLSPKGCNVEGYPTSPGTWNLQVQLEAKCQGIDFGKLNIPITIIIKE